MNHRFSVFHFAAMVTLPGLFSMTGCQPADRRVFQGYVEAEFVYVASPLAGQLETLSAHKGGQVKAGALLFALEHTAEKAARDEAARRLQQSQATLADLKKGRRPTEMQSLQAQLAQAETASQLSGKELTRLEKLVQSGAASREDLDRALAARDQDAARVVQLKADLQTAQLGSRDDQVAAAEHEVAAREAALSQAEWNLSQKRQFAPREGLIFDILYREGEWVPVGRPVIALLPAANIKVRTFIPETLIGTLQTGQPMLVTVDGREEPVRGTIRFISPKAEYTPPVIYSRESRSKLVFMVELSFEPSAALQLHPGQPVDVQLAP